MSGAYGASGNKGPIMLTKSGSAASPSPWAQAAKLCLLARVGGRINTGSAGMWGQDGVCQQPLSQGPSRQSAVGYMPAPGAWHRSASGAFARSC